jgi:hypothetical protein
MEERITMKNVQSQSGRKGKRTRKNILVTKFIVILPYAGIHQTVGRNGGVGLKLQAWNDENRSVEDLRPF